jgi:2-(1,2-epoxy-1,2-dihydrophenyl)acetyl-CoA isomerase
LTLLGEKLTAIQAAEWGLIWRCVSDDQLISTVRAVALQLAAGPTRGYVRTRQAIDAAMLLPLDSALDFERDYQRELGRSNDYREGVSAFIEKRVARFTGQ